MRGKENETHSRQNERWGRRPMNNMEDLGTKQSKLTKLEAPWWDMARVQAKE